LGIVFTIYIYKGETMGFHLTKEIPKMGRKRLYEK